MLSVSNWGLSVFDERGNSSSASSSADFRIGSFLSIELRILVVCCSSCPGERALLMTPNSVQECALIDSISCRIWLFRFVIVSFQILVFEAIGCLRRYLLSSSSLIIW